jgi:hypothetical protein
MGERRRSKVVANNKNLVRIHEIVEASWNTRQPITLKFQTGMARPLEECLVSVRYDRKADDE